MLQETTSWEVPNWVLFNQLQDHLLSAKAHQITETILDLIEPKNYKFLLNALNGISNEPPFKIGDIVRCTSRTHLWTEQETTEGDEQVTYKQEYREIGWCTVEKVEKYEHYQLTVAYDTLDKEGKEIRTTDRVTAANCHDKIEPPPPPSSEIEGW